MRVLYITHYGILEPLGQTQILPYLSGLATKGISVDILSFEKLQMLQDHSMVHAQSDRLRSLDIRWHPRAYRRSKFLPYLLADVMVTAYEIRKRCVRDGIDLLHCRSHVPSWMAWSATKRYCVPLLFDFRGLLAEEYVDSGLWKPGGAAFRLTKAFERRVARGCAALVVLTEPARDYLQKAYSLDAHKMFIIPCCVDLAKFRAERSMASAPQRPLGVVYAGSTSGRYRIKEMLDFFTLLLSLRPGSKFTILSSGDSRPVRQLVEKSGLSLSTVRVECLPAGGIPEVLAQQDLGLVFLNGDRALLASSPTKLGEYLATGLIVVAENGLGDLRRILVDQRVGCLIDSGRRDTWKVAAEEALRLCDQPCAREGSRRAAATFFSLADGIERYFTAYNYAVKRGANPC
ncbi:MAG TPA: glycosyltransferase [Acidobacteriota bacterium]|nr:glycosyltransferase [Acidobacteriota bacterium]